MKEGFRQSMAWLHTWSGLLVGWVLFAMFATGTSAYFRDDITLWMKPELHAAQAHAVPAPQAAEQAVARLQAVGEKSPRWFISLPDAHDPSMRITWAPAPAPKGDKAPKNQRRRFDSETLDPATGEPMVKARETRGGEFLYRFHFDLHYMPAIWARWIVGACAMFMLVAIISGIITHRRIFSDFFTFRPRKGQRSWLDGHNATAVLALPFHLMITYTGLITLMFLYMPWGSQTAYKGDEKTFFAEVFPSSNGNAKPSGERVALAPIGPMVARATEHWQGTPPGRITVELPNDANATVVLTRQSDITVSYKQPVMRFNGATGEMIGTQGDELSGAMQTHGVLYGLHVAHFATPLIRPLFFLCGLAGCAMVGTGLLLWAVKERQKYAKVLAKGGRVSFGLRLVDGLNIGAVAGVPLAIAAYFWANRLLAVDLPERTAAEIAWFFKAWGFVAVLGLLRPTRGMWLGLLVLDGLAFALIPVLNAFTTDTHLGVTLLNGPWPVAAFDLTVLGLGLLFLFSAWMLHKHKPKAKTAKVAKAVKPAAPKVDKATVAPQPAAATATLADKPAPSRGQPFLDGDGLPEVQGS
ncbi:MAG TPA: PepSY domain-containing protein [Candidatus Aquabacterium excrementipullorum]|nr:PepSY domain-containing protein [Candidatus Aquabacterium excrementipullorum]